MRLYGQMQGEGVGAQIEKLKGSKGDGPWPPEALREGQDGLRIKSGVTNGVCWATKKGRKGFPFRP